MPKFDTQVQELKYRILKEVAKSYDRGTLEEDIDQIPYVITPHGAKPTFRCCVYHEREIVKERVKLAMGGDKKNPNIVEVIPSACDQCPFGGITVTDACRGCLAHRCAQACRLNCITFENLRAKINKDKCVNCGQCAKACPFGAISNLKRPCEAACKIGAISHRSEGSTAHIDEEKCTRCGACSYSCPFGAIMDKSYILECIDLMKANEKGEINAYMIVAPSVSSQFHGVRLTQVITGMKKLGFHSVVEAALGADMVSYYESKELSEKGKLTSSCCPAFVRYVETSFPTLKQYVSHNLSPMAMIARYIKDNDPKAKTCFVGPCIAKKMEMFREDSAPYVDCVITFEELQALLDMREIKLAELEDSPLDNASYYGRIFARCGGLSEAVQEALKERNDPFVVKGVSCSGLEECKRALTMMKNGRIDANFIEGMACVGGCIGGPCCLTHEVRDAADVDKYGRESKEKTIVDAVKNLVPLE